MNLLYQFLKDNWVTVGLCVVIAALYFINSAQSRQIKTLEIDVNEAGIAMERAQAAADAQAIRVDALNKSNAVRVAALTDDYRRTIRKERDAHAETYKVAIAHADALGRMRLATGQGGDGAVPQDGAAAAGVDAYAEGGQAAESVSVGDCIDAAVQIEGLQRYIETELAHINGVIHEKDE